jgi:3-hydroxyphenylacetate 6-hydroxylase
MALPTHLDLFRENWLDISLKIFSFAVMIISATYVAYNEYIRVSARVSGIKGPTGLPLIGNLWSIRRNAPEQYRVWSKKYGGVYQVSLGNVPIIVVNSAAAAKYIFSQHAQAMSSRPQFYTFHKVGLCR